MKDRYGYEELVVHPPPLNCLVLILVPSLFRPHMMQGTARIYGRLIFCIENVFYIIYFVLYCLCLIPYIYVRLLVNILMIASGPKFKTAMMIWVGWVLGGLFYLLYTLIMDTYRYINILCDLKEDQDDFESKQKDDQIQDKICIYNEIIDTLRAVMNIFRFHYKMRGMIEE